MVHVIISIHNSLQLKISCNKSKTHCAMGSIGDYFLLEVVSFSDIEYNHFFIFHNSSMVLKYG